MFTSLLQQISQPQPAPAPQLNLKTPWSNRSKLLCGSFLVGTAVSAISVVHDVRDAAADTMVVPETMVNRMLQEPAQAVADPAVTTF